MNNIIEVKNLGKKYTINHHRGSYVALRDILTAIMKSPFKFLKKKAKEIAGIDTKEDFWALKDVSFNIEPGEVVGVIGRNGAGKSTLLKILTGITPPTTGEIRMKGKVASLLEVGTGFHPELTGRENIFLNGAILGMTKKEIVEKFDEIVAFAGIDKFLDTPVKYYSSGMYVRLAFSVAAHMEPDILLVDEVLAVGDAEFQKKCLGKMEEVTKKSGRTILFVSHNMAAIQSLCKKCILLEKGTVKMVGETKEVVTHYLNDKSGNTTSISLTDKNIGNDIAKLLGARMVYKTGEEATFVFSDKEVGVEMDFEVLQSNQNLVPNIHIFTRAGEYAFISHSDLDVKLNNTGKHRATAWIPANLLNEGTYIVGIALSTMIPLKVHFYAQEALVFQVMTNLDTAKKNDFNQRIPGVVRPKLNWNIK
ncbi:MAG: ABC transporter ATP-binding protein [Candidatus Paceibacterota bacterium]|jgi:lipopolysaccharide transport system ATP-binding protein